MNLDELRSAWQEASPILWVTATLISVAGTGLSTALLANLFHPRAADAGTVVEVGQAFLATWPLSIAAAIIAFGIAAGFVQRLGSLLSLAAAAATLAVALAVAVGGTTQVPIVIGGPPTTARTIGNILSEFFDLYGQDLFLAGMVAGAGVGVFACRFTVSLGQNPSQ